MLDGQTSANIAESLVKHNCVVVYPTSVACIWARGVKPEGPDPVLHIIAYALFKMLDRTVVMRAALEQFQQHVKELSGYKRHVTYLTQMTHYRQENEIKL